MFTKDEFQEKIRKYRLTIKGGLVSGPVLEGIKNKLSLAERELKKFDKWFVDTNATEICFLALRTMLRYRLVRLIKEEVDEMASEGSVTREETIAAISNSAEQMIHFIDVTNVPNDEEELTKNIMEASTEYLNWESELWDRFQQIHQGEIEMNTSIPVNEVIDFPNDSVIDALDELSFQGVILALMEYD